MTFKNQYKSFNKFEIGYNLGYIKMFQFHTIKKKKQKQKLKSQIYFYLFKSDNKTIS